jgi:hypothetical protein
MGEEAALLVDAMVDDYNRQNGPSNRWQPMGLHELHLLFRFGSALEALLPRGFLMPKLPLDQTAVVQHHCFAMGDEAQQLLDLLWAKMCARAGVKTCER